MLRGRWIITLIVLGVAAIFMVAFTASIAIESRNCAYASDQYRLPTNYDWMAGCYDTLADGERIELDKYRAVERVTR